jgi:hypothetical protein
MPSTSGTFVTNPSTHLKRIWQKTSMGMTIEFVYHTEIKDSILSKDRKIDRKMANQSKVGRYIE